MKKLFLWLKERVSRYGRKALLLWLCWVVLKWTLFLYFGGMLWRYFQ